MEHNDNPEEKAEDKVATKKINTDLFRSFVPSTLIAGVYIGVHFYGILGILPAVGLSLFLGLWLDKKFPRGWRDLRK